MDTQSCQGTLSWRQSLLVTFLLAGLFNVEGGLTNQVELNQGVYYSLSMHQTRVPSPSCQTDCDYQNTTYVESTVLSHGQRKLLSLDLFSGLDEAFLGVAITLAPNPIPGETYPTSILYTYAHGEPTEVAYSGLNEMEFTLNTGVKIFCLAFKNVYMYSKGYISFDYQYAATSFTSLPAQGNYILAPIFGQLEACPTCNIYFGQYSSSDTSATTTSIIERANTDVNTYEGTSSFSATDVLVFSWYGMHPIPWNNYFETSPANKGTTFQAVVITDGRKTYAIFNYQEQGINLTPLLNDVHMGYVFKSFKGRVSYLSGKAAMQDIATSAGNYGTKGSYIFELFKERTTGDLLCDQIEANCVQWLNRAVSGAYLAPDPNFPPCPTSTSLAAVDQRFTADSTTDNSECFVQAQDYNVVIPRLAVETAVRQQCCYSTANGALITQHSVDLTPGRMQFVSTSPSDDLGFHRCCFKSNRFCTTFYQYRPINTGSRYQPFDAATSFADPHFITLDKTRYTFNGLGEYWLVKTTDNSFGLQGRTIQVLNNEGEETAATVFSAFAFKYKDQKGEIRMTRARDGMELVVDGKDETDFLNEPEETSRDFGDFLVKKNGSDTVYVIFGTAADWTVAIRLGAGMLHQTVMVSPTQTGKTMGLLGPYNGNPDDDFTRRDGDVLPPDSTDEKIFNDFGKNWAIRRRESYFTYVSGTSWNTYRHDDFVPDFEPCNNTTLASEAIGICGGPEYKECVFDYCITGQTSVAMNTNERSIYFIEENRILENKPPTLTGPSALYVTLGETIEATVTATDPEGDSAVVELTDFIPGATLERGTGTGVFRWQLRDLTPISISFIARDSRGAVSPIMSILLVVCNGCSRGNGDCDFSRYEVDGAITSFAVARCSCKPGYKGNDCSQNIDGCEGDPCATFGTACHDLTPQQEASGQFSLPYRCDCPAGFQDVQGVCVDINECDSVLLNDCEQMCENTHGSFQCSCGAGYRSAGHLCTDINECSEGTHDCDHLCENKNGTYACLCYPGYHLEDNVCVKDEVADECTLECEHFCVVEDGNSTCHCRPGYQLNGDGTTCQDVDECSTQQLNRCTGTCHNMEGSYNCSCPPGFHLAHDKRSCQSCDAMHWGVECDNFCDCGVNILACDPVVGCTGCQDGWTGDDCEQNVNECAVPGISLCDQPNEVCYDTDGSYECVCDIAYERNEMKHCVETPPGFVMALNMTYQDVFDEFDHPTTLAFMGRFSYGVSDVLSGIDNFGRARITNIRRGSTVVEFTLDFIKDTDYLVWPQALYMLRRKLQKNEGTLYGSHGSHYPVELFEFQFPNGTQGRFEEPCNLLDALGGCQNGGTCSSDKGVSCLCPLGYTGPVCGQRATDGDYTTVTAIAASSGAVVVLVIVFVVVILYMKRRARKDFGKTRMSETSSEASGPSVYSHTRYAPAYRPHMPMGWTTWKTQEPGQYMYGSYTENDFKSFFDFIKHQQS